MVLGIAAGLLSVLLGGATAEGQQTISILASNAITGPLRALAGAHTARTGQEVRIEFDTTPNIGRRVAAGETWDAILGTVANVEQAIAQGRAIADSRAAIGKLGVGVAVGRGAPLPDIGSPDAFKASLLRAEGVLYSAGASGVYIERMLKALGIAGELKGRMTQLPTGAEVMARLASRRADEIGFNQVSQILDAEAHGVQLVGLLPAPLQNDTSYEAVVLSASGSRDAARAFLRSLTTPAARKVLAANGWRF